MTLLKFKATLLEILQCRIVGKDQSGRLTCPWLNWLVKMYGHAW